MGVTVSVNKRTVVHKESGGKSIAMPDVCLTQCGPAVVPIPYPNMAQSGDMDNGAQTVKADGNPMGHEKSFFKKSTGDEAGANKGVASGTIQGKAQFASFSFDVQVEGKGVVRAFDSMVHNNKNTPPTPLIQSPLSVEVMDETPVIPTQNKVSVKFVDPFGESVEGVEFETEFGEEKEKRTTMGRGQIFHVNDKAAVDVSLYHSELGLKEDKE